MAAIDYAVLASYGQARVSAVRIIPNLTFAEIEAVSESTTSRVIQTLGW